MNNKHQESLKSIERLLLIMDDLRAQCPWDKKQTMETLRTLTIEETYELADAIIDDDMEEVKKELGDLLLHIAFYSKIGDEKGLFDIGKVAEAISDKLVDRHPHIYGDVTVADEAEVKRNWEKLKLKEGKDWKYFIATSWRGNCGGCMALHQFSIDEGFKYHGRIFLYPQTMYSNPSLKKIDANGNVIYDEEINL